MTIFEVKRNENHTLQMFHKTRETFKEKPPQRSFLAIYFPMMI